MTHHLHRIRQRVASNDDRGAAMAEYGLLLAFVAMVVILVAASLGETIADFFGFATDTFNDSPALAGETNGS